MIKRITFLLTALLLSGCGKPAQPIALDHPPERIVSLAPNITETLYALGLGEKLVGSTTHCTYPEAARAVPRIGGFGQFNYEAIVTARPDLVILHKEYETDNPRNRHLFHRRHPRNHPKHRRSLRCAGTGGRANCPT